MLASVFTSVIAYISTNLDDIFVLMVLLAQTARGRKGRLVAGHFLGGGIVTAISMLGAFGLQNLPLKYVGLLGLVPIALGIRAWLANQEDDEPERGELGLLGMAMVTVGNGADNVGVYIPLFTGFSGAERLGAAAVFAAMTALWVWLANALAEFPRVKTLTERYQRILIPVVFIGLGVYILLDSGLFG